MGVAVTVAVAAAVAYLSFVPVQLLLLLFDRGGLHSLGPCVSEKKEAQGARCLFTFCLFSLSSSLSLSLSLSLKRMTSPDKHGGKRPFASVLCAWRVKEAAAHCGSVDGISL